MALRIALVGMALILTLAPGPAMASRMCLWHERNSPSTGPLHTGPICSEDGRESNSINLGDDTGWRNQLIYFTYTGGGQVCMDFKAQGGGGGWKETGWKCSADGDMSPVINMGDDTGWRDQQLRILSTTSKPVCFRHTRQSGSSGDIVSTGLVCSSNNVPSDSAGIGDDTGWVNQALTIWADNPRG